MEDGSHQRILTLLRNQFRGVSEDGYLVVAHPLAHSDEREYLVGLSPCCNVYPKGGENGTVCGFCYRPVDVALTGEMKLALCAAQPQSTEDLISAAGTAARDEGAELGMLSLITTQGTAMAEATLCVECINEKTRSEAWKAASRADDATLSPVWEVSSGNDSVACISCGRGAFPSEMPGPDGHDSM